MNVIASTLIYSSKLMVIFMMGLIMLNLMMVPLAQAIWGT
jgi:hypothetical protein